MAQKKTTKKKATTSAARKKSASASSKKPAAAYRATAAKSITAPKIDMRSFAPSLNKMIDFNQPMEDMMTKSKTQYDQLTKDAANMSRESMEALSKCGSIFTKGMEEIVRASMSMAQEISEKQAQFFQQAMGTKSINEFAELQNKAAQKSYDELVAGATKISEMSVKTLTEASQPIQEQMNKAIQKASQAMAA